MIRSTDRRSGEFQGDVEVLKFLYSYGGKILPRPTDGKLRYVGGETRVLAVDRSVGFAELLVKLGELCGESPVCLKCQFPTEDLDTLISVVSDEDLKNLIEEYDRFNRNRENPVKIRAFLAPSRIKKSVVLLQENRTATKRYHQCTGFPARRVHQIRAPAMHHGVVYMPVGKNSGGSLEYAPYYIPGKSSNAYMIHNGNHWQ